MHCATSESLNVFTQLQGKSLSDQNREHTVSCQLLAVNEGLKVDQTPVCISVCSASPTHFRSINTAPARLDQTNLMVPYQSKHEPTKKGQHSFLSWIKASAERLNSNATVGYKLQTLARNSPPCAS